MRHAPPLNSLLLTLLGLGLTACATQGAPGPQAWIDAPRHASTHELAPLEIVVHAADPGGVAMVEVSIDGEVFVRRAPDNPTAPLTTFRVGWDPQSGGEVVLAARAYSHSGTWGDATTNTIRLTGPAASALPAVQRTAPTAGAQPTAFRPTLTPPPRQAPSATPVPSCSNVARFIADVNYPDDSLVSPGQGLTKLWRLRNDGTCTWNESYTTVFVGGDSMGNDTPRPISAVVPPGGMLDVAVDLIAPTSAGTYRGDYQLRDPQGAQFGLGAGGQTPFYVQIVVGRPVPAEQPTSPPPPDTQAPSVGVSHSPSGSSLPTGSTITFSANASDNLGVVTIELWVTAPGGWPTLVKTCANSSSCSFTGGPYPTQGNLTYFAIARDAAGNQSSSNSGAIQLYVVITQLLRLAL